MLAVTVTDEPEIRWLWNMNILVPYELGIQYDFDVPRQGLQRRNSLVDMRVYLTSGNLTHLVMPVTLCKSYREVLLIIRLFNNQIG